MANFYNFVTEQYKEVDDLINQLEKKHEFFTKNRSVGYKTFNHWVEENWSNMENENCIIQITGHRIAILEKGKEYRLNPILSWGHGNITSNSLDLENQGIGMCVHEYYNEIKKSGLILQTIEQHSNCYSMPLSMYANINHLRSEIKIKHKQVKDSVKNSLMTMFLNNEEVYLGSKMFINDLEFDTIQFVRTKDTNKTGTLITTVNGVSSTFPYKRRVETMEGFCEQIVGNIVGYNPIIP
jgi:hypothetical protein